jgi:Ran GTPase-activating protein 1
MASVELLSPPSTADPLCFTIKAATLKFETREDILPFLKPLIESHDVEEVHLGGNTYGVEACKALGEILATKKNLKVCPFHCVAFITPFPRAQNASLKKD